MIINVPSEIDFRNSGIGFINLALDKAFELLQIIDETGLDCCEESEEEFWENAQIPLSNSLVLIQQGIEFIIKSKIAHISHFLLIASNPSDWPKSSNNNDLSFSEFRTIDAQDLIKVHNIVNPNILSDEFIRKFKELKNIRNVIIHSVDKNIKIFVEDIILTSLLVFHELIGPNLWLENRREYLSNTPISVAYSSSDINETECEIIHEIYKIIDLLSPSELKKHFDYNIKQRNYYCPGCRQHSIYDNFKQIMPTAQLNPNKPDSTSIYCFICDNEYDVVRNKCDNDGCKGNVIYQDLEELCLTCFNN